MRPFALASSLECRRLFTKSDASFATKPVRVNRMERTNKAVKMLFAEMTQRGERSTLFWWFVENHDDILEGARRQRIQWAVVVQRAVGLGLTNRIGASPSRKLAKLTWQRAQTYVARVRKADGQQPVRPASPFSIPRSADVQPVAAERPDSWHGPGVSNSAYHSNNSSLSAEVDASVSTHLIPVSSKSPVMPAPEPVWTPEQIAHRDAMLAKARARLAHTDRFLNLRE